MRQLTLSLLLAIATLSAQAQTTPEPTIATSQSPTTPQPTQFGYISMKTAMQSMADYAVVQRNLEDLKTKYDDEMKRVEDEFNKKYELFLEGQRDFAPSILQKRQAELQELMEKNIAFKQKARQLLEQAEQDAYKPLKEKLTTAMKTVAQRHGLAFILNTDGDALPYVDETRGIDVTAEVLEVTK